MTSSDSTWMKAHHSLHVCFVWMMNGTQSLTIKAINSSEDSNYLWTHPNLCSFIIFNDYFVPIGFQRAYCLILHKWKSLPIVKDQSSLITAPLSSRKWKAWKARARTSLRWDQLTLKQPWENFACSIGDQCQELLRRFAICAHSPFLPGPRWYFPLAGQWYVMNLHASKTLCAL